MNTNSIRKIILESLSVESEFHLDKQDVFTDSEFVKNSTSYIDAGATKYTMGPNLSPIDQIRWNITNIVRHINAATAKIKKLDSNAADWEGRKYKDTTKTYEKHDIYGEFGGVGSINAANARRKTNTIQALRGIKKQQEDNIQEWRRQLRQAKHELDMALAKEKTDVSDNAPDVDDLFVGIPKNDRDRMKAILLKQMGF